MSTPADDPARRTLLKTAAAGLAASLAGSALAQSARAAAAPPLAASPGRPLPAPGQPGEFDFLAGEWRIRHRRLKSAASGAWDEFDGEATCWTILDGVGSVEELRIPARDFSGMGLRLLDRETRVWSDFWVNAKSGVLGAAGLTGGFVDGAGVFTAEDTDDGKPIVVRGIWDEITPTSCRWRQGVSRDGGAHWDDNWIMHWRRA